VVGRDGGPDGLTVMVDYYTEDGTANADSDYLPRKGTLTFYPEDKHQKISIEIVDDDVFEEDEHFYLHLTNLRVRTRDGLILVSSSSRQRTESHQPNPNPHVQDPTRLGGVPVAMLEMPTTATIMILGWLWPFPLAQFPPEQSIPVRRRPRRRVLLRVRPLPGGRELWPHHAASAADQRLPGPSVAALQVSDPHRPILRPKQNRRRTFDGSATGGKHFEEKESGELLFDDNQTE
jgi:hypothetical protein